jgi:DnaJ-class molecular chaperone
MSDAHDRKPPAARRTSKASSSAAGDGGEDDSAAAEPREPQPCMPCHGTGKVISSLGEKSRKVTCPWCRGGGVRLTGMDAQEWQQEQVKLKRH